jgi:hypothetical protein
MKNITLFMTVILIGIASCQKDVYLYVQANRKPIIPEGDTIVYKSNLGNVDSFKIHLDDEIQQSDQKYYKEHINIWYHRINCLQMLSRKDSLMCDVGMWYTVPYENELSYVQVPGLYWTKTRQVVDLNIDSVTFKNVNKMIDTANHNTNEISTVYATDKYGILRYDYVDGEYYELIKK